MVASSPGTRAFADAVALRTEGQVIYIHFPPPFRANPRILAHTVWIPLYRPNALPPPPTQHPLSI
jgi:hypothetical protein